MDHFAEKLIECRRKKDLTQDALAAALNVSRTTVSSWERGRTEPDIAMLKRLSQLMEYDFIHAEGQEAPEPETETTDQSDGSDRRAGTRWIIAGVALLLCVVLVCAFLVPRSRKSDFDAAFYRQQTANDPARPYLSFENRTWEEGSRDNVYWRYEFTLHEKNGKPCHVTRVAVSMEGLVNGGTSDMEIDADGLRSLGLEPDIPANGSLTLNGGFPKGQFGHVGVTVRIEDDDGNANVFYDLI